MERRAFGLFVGLFSSLVILAGPKARFSIAQGKSALFALAALGYVLGANQSAEGAIYLDGIS